MTALDWLARALDTVLLAAAAQSAVSPAVPSHVRGWRLLALAHLERAYGPRGGIVTALAQIDVPRFATAHFVEVMEWAVSQ